MWTEQLWWSGSFLLNKQRCFGRLDFSLHFRLWRRGCFSKQWRRQRRTGWRQCAAAPYRLEAWKRRRKMSKTLTFAQILSSPVCLQPPPSSSLSRSLFLLRWSFLSSFLKRLSKSWQLTKIFQTQLRKSPKTTKTTTMSTSIVRSSGVGCATWRMLNSTHSIFVLNFWVAAAAPSAALPGWTQSFAASQLPACPMPLQLERWRKLRKEELHHAASGFTSLRLPPLFSKKAWEPRQKSPMWKN